MFEVIINQNIRMFLKFSFHIYIKAKFGYNSLWMPATSARSRYGQPMCLYHFVKGGIVSS
jgi:hypothetical protein